MVRFRVMATSPQVELPVEPSRCWRCYATNFDSCRGDGARQRKIQASDALPQKIDDATNESRRSINLEIDIPHGASFASGPSQQSGCRGECRTGRRIRQPTQRARSAKTHLLVENPTR